MTETGTRGADGVSRWKKRIVHPFLFAAYPVLAAYATNQKELSFVDILRPLAGAVLIAGILFVAFRGATRSWSKGAAMTSALLLAFFVLWKPLFKVLIFKVADVAEMSARYIFVGYVLAALLVAAWIWKRRAPGPSIHAFVNIVGAALVVMATGQAVFQWFSSIHHVPPSPKLTQAARRPETASYPDIYFIVLDGYGRADVLKEHLGYDNSPFLDAMRGRGFFVVEHSHVSYSATWESLTACLNMDFLANIDPLAAAEDQPHLRELYHHGAVRRVLEELGYAVASFETGFRFTEPDSSYDMALTYEESWWEPSLFEFCVMDYSPILPILRNLGYSPGFANWRRQLLYVIDNLQVPALAINDRPVFVQAHIICPHEPFLFRADGSPVPPTGSFSLAAGDDARPPQELAARLYVEQLRFLNTRIETAVDRILEHSEVPPIIAIVSDHGITPSVSGFPEGRAYNLIMIHLLGVSPTELPNDLNLVQLFPLILNRQFDLHIPMPENER